MSEVYQIPFVLLFTAWLALDLSVDLCNFVQHQLTL